MDTAEHVAALEYELAQARGTRAGGQPPNTSRIAAIEEAIRVAKKTGRRSTRETTDARPAPSETPTETTQA